MSSIDPNVPSTAARPVLTPTAEPESQGRPARPRPFTTRREAGRALAEELGVYASDQPVVLGLPRGGLPVAFEVASALGSALEPWGARRLHVPIAPELSIAAVAEGGVLELELDAVAEVGLTPAAVRGAAGREHAALSRELAMLRGSRPPPVLKDRTVILVDDVIASGATVKAALLSIRNQHPREVILAAAVASEPVLRRLKPLVDELVVLRRIPADDPLRQVFASAAELESAALRALLDRAWGARSAEGAPLTSERLSEHRVEVVVAGARANLRCVRPADALAATLVLGSRASTPALLERFHSRRIATVSWDPEPVLSAETADAWAATASEVALRDSLTRDLPLGAFGMGVAAGALLAQAATSHASPNVLALAETEAPPRDRALLQARAPTLLLAREDVASARALHRWIGERMGGVTELSVLPRSPELLAGRCLDELVDRTVEWFEHRLMPHAAPAKIWDEP